MARELPSGEAKLEFDGLRLDNYTREGYPKDHPAYLELARQVNEEHRHNLTRFQEIIGIKIAAK